MSDYFNVCFSPEYDGSSGFVRRSIGGWEAWCDCWWTEKRRVTKEEAQGAYQAHRKAARSDGGHADDRQIYWHAH